MSHRRVVASLLVLCLSGCLEETQTVTLEPDGMGTLRVERTLGKEMSDMLLGGASDKAAAARGVAARQLGEMGGIAAWTDVEATVTDDQRVRFVATGWFEDLARIETEKQGSKVAMFLVDRQGDAMTIRLRQDEGSGADEKSFFDRDPQELEMMRGMIGGLAAGMLKGLSSDVVLSLPGATTELGSGWTSQEAGDRPTVGAHMDAPRVVHMLERMLAAGEELRPKVASGEMTKEAADLELQRRMASELDTRVVFTPDAAKATPDFAARLAAARAAWEASPWRADVERARDGGASSGRRQAEPPPEGLTRATPDALEPNDSAEAATPITGATTLKDLLLEEGGEDWFRVDVPKGKELTVTARFDSARGDIDLELQDAEGGPLRTSSTMNNLERLRVAAREARTVLVRLYGGSSPYHLEVALVDYVPGDAFEPNDSREEAATIQAGTAEGLAADGEDWYRLEAPAGKLVDITIRFAPGEAYLDLSVASAQEAGAISGSDGVSASARVRCFAPDGPLLFCVSGGAQAPVKYSMTIAVLEPPAKDRLEPNDSLAAARALAPGKHADLVLESDDWYRLDLRDKKELRIAVRKTDDSLPGEVALTLYVPGAKRGEEVELASARSAFSGEAVLTIARPRAGPVFARVTGGIVPYSLEVTAADHAAEDALEPNDYRLDARPIRAGKVEKLQCGGDDWYRLDLKAGEALSAAARFVHADGDLDLELQDAQGSFLGSSNGSSDEEKVDLEPDAAPRIVFVHVYPTDRSKRTPYALELTVTKRP